MNETRLSDCFLSPTHCLLQILFIVSISTVSTARPQGLSCKNDLTAPPNIKPDALAEWRDGIIRRSRRGQDMKKKEEAENKMKREGLLS